MLWLGFSASGPAPRIERAQNESLQNRRASQAQARQSHATGRAYLSNPAIRPALNRRQ